MLSRIPWGRGIILFVEAGREAWGPGLAMNKGLQFHPHQQALVAMDALIPKTFISRM